MNIDEFLSRRDQRINEVEIANKLFAIIGTKLSNINRFAFSEDASNDGDIYQFFAYIQYLLRACIFTGFCAVIGSYDKKMIP